MKIEPGWRRNAWTCVAVHGDGSVVVRCDCGRERTVRQSRDGRTHMPISKSCRACSNRAGRLEQLIDPNLPWDQDPVARGLVESWGPMTQEELAFFYGLSRQRVDQLEQAAIKSLLKRAVLNPALRELFEAKRDAYRETHWDAMTERWAVGGCETQSNDLRWKPRRARRKGRAA